MKEKVLKHIKNVLMMLVALGAVASAYVYLWVVYGG